MPPKDLGNLLSTQKDALIFDDWCFTPGFRMNPLYPKPQTSEENSGIRYPKVPKRKGSGEANPGKLSLTKTLDLVLKLVNHPFVWMGNGWVTPKTLGHLCAAKFFWRKFWGDQVSMFPIFFKVTMFWMEWLKVTKKTLKKGSQLETVRARK